MWAQVERLAAERMIEEMDRMPLASLPFMGGIAHDKHALVVGGVTARVERVGGPSVASVKDFIDALPVVSGSVVEGGGAHSKGAAGGGLGMIEGGGLAVDLAGESGGGDSVSPDNAGSSEEGKP